MTRLDKRFTIASLLISSEGLERDLWVGWGRYDLVVGKLFVDLVTILKKGIYKNSGISSRF